jgi:hypothetical protein
MIPENTAIDFDQLLLSIFASIEAMPQLIAITLLTR